MKPISKDGLHVKGLVFDVQRMSLHDGPGIRTTVFLKGCGLRCAWCHNPESLSPIPQLAFTSGLCIGCGYCFQRCPEKAHLMEGDTHQLDRSRCVGCFSCIEGCQGGALEVVGREMSVEEVLAEVLRDKVYYEASGGGLTLSGGEPLTQFTFTQSLLRVARACGLHTCLETSGFGAAGDIVDLVPWVDLFLYDVKETDPERHRIYTGQDNAEIMDNLRRLDAAGAAVILRCVIVPEVNLRDDHLECLAALARSLRNVRGIELMGYHPLGEGKRQRLGRSAASASVEGFGETTPMELNKVAERLKALDCKGVTIC